MAHSTKALRTVEARYSYTSPTHGGVQLVHRIFTLLRVVASERGGGLRLTEIAERSQLRLPTVHRLLRSLEAERAVIYDPFMRVYYIGYDFLQHPHETLEARLKQHFRPLLEDIAEHLRDTALLATRHGQDVLYIDMVEAAFPPGKPMVVGGRRPLGTGPTGVVLLGCLPLRQQHEIMEVNAQRYLRFNGVDRRQVRAMLTGFRRDGYAFGGSIVPGLSSVALPLFDVNGTAVAALAVSSTSERLESPRRAELVGWLTERVGRFEQFDPTK